MNDLILPLFALWALNRERSASPAVITHASAPPWPTPASPPPMPAFESQPTPSADPSQSSTPLADLHKAPPTLAPAHAKVKVKPRASTPESIKQAAISTFKKKATTALRSQAQQRADNAFRNFLTPKNDSALSVPVADVQKILIRRGVKISPDGLYGPRTASAWSKLASSKHLPATITRVNPKVVKVVTRTYDSLSTPAIP